LLGLTTTPSSELADGSRRRLLDRLEAKNGQTLGELCHAKPSWPRALRVALIWVILWSAPVLLPSLWLGRNHTVVQEGIFFSKVALVTFGGAYAVLPYVAQQAVQTHHWLSAGQMLDGLGLAETTPGPLIMVTQFVGFLGGWNHPGQLPPLLAATIGALITTWTTFTPCFLWVFLGGPYIEKLRGNEALTTTLSAVTAAVVGVVLDLAVWFGLHVIFPGDGTVDAFAILGSGCSQRQQNQAITPMGSISGDIVGSTSAARRRYRADCVSGHQLHASAHAKSSWFSGHLVLQHSQRRFSVC
jgi:chromate transport protein ChrA